MRRGRASGLHCVCPDADAPVGAVVIRTDQVPHNRRRLPAPAGGSVWSAMAQGTSRGTRSKHWQASTQQAHCKHATQRNANAVQTRHHATARPATTHHAGLDPVRVHHARPARRAIEVVVRGRLLTRPQRLVKRMARRVVGKVTGVMQPHNRNRGRVLGVGGELVADRAPAVVGNDERVGKARGVEFAPQDLCVPAVADIPISVSVPCSLYVQSPSVFLVPCTFPIVRHAAHGGACDGA